jgi:hypothetical protein
MTRYARINGKLVWAVPEGAIAWKYADSTEGARWVYDPADLEEIEAADPSLIEPLYYGVRDMGRGAK